MSSKHASVRAPGKEHIPIYPQGFIALRIVQLVLSLIVIGLASYGVSLLAFDGDIFIMVVGIMTLISSIYLLVSEFGAPAIYNYWAVLSLDIFLIIMWLASMGLLASEVSYAMSDQTTCYLDYCETTGGFEGPWIDCLAGACGVAGIEFVLYIVSLSIHGVMMHQHRSAGLHCMPVTGGVARITPGPASTYSTEMKPQTNASYQAIQAAPPVGYPQHTITPQPAHPPHTAPPPVQQPQPYYPLKTPSPLTAQPTGYYPQQPNQPEMPVQPPAQGYPVQYQQQ